LDYGFFTEKEKYQARFLEIEERESLSLNIFSNLQDAKKPGLRSLKKKCSFSTKVTESFLMDIFIQY